MGINGYRNVILIELGRLVKKCLVVSQRIFLTSSPKDGWWEGTGEEGLREHAWRSSLDSQIQIPNRRVQGESVEEGD